MNTIDHLPEPALACVRRLDCPICAWRHYVPADWPVAVCLGCVANPHVRAQLQDICDNALERSAQAVQAYEEAESAAPPAARAAMERLMTLRTQITDAPTKAAFLAAWQDARQIGGLPRLAELWKIRTATGNACAQIIETTLPRLNTLLSAIATLEQHDATAR